MDHQEHSTWQPFLEFCEKEQIILGGLEWEELLWNAWVAGVEYGVITGVKAAMDGIAETMRAFREGGA